MRTFEHFPDGTTCIVCGKNDDKECILIEIVNTTKGNISKAKPVHVDCCLSNLQYDPSLGIIYILALREDM
jgi:hypothetical protein